MREYLSVEEASKVIAGEVAQNGTSREWVGNTEIAREIEQHLAKFNIGYIDPKTGTWSHRRNGTRYFTAIKMLNVAKNKVGSLLSNIKK